MVGYNDNIKISGEPIKELEKKKKKENKPKNNPITIQLVNYKKSLMKEVKLNFFSTAMSRWTCPAIFTSRIFTNVFTKAIRLAILFKLRSRVSGFITDVQRRARKKQVIILHRWNSPRKQNKPQTTYRCTCRLGLTRDSVSVRSRISDPKHCIRDTSVGR